MHLVTRGLKWPMVSHEACQFESIHISMMAVQPGLQAELRIGRLHGTCLHNESRFHPLVCIDDHLIRGESGY